MTATKTTGAGTSSMTMVPIGSIIPSPTNKLHREDWELDEKKDPSFADLIKSIDQHGIAQPILVRPNDVAGKFYLVCGERRFSAAKKAGVKEIPALVKALTDAEAFELQITENLQRKDVHPLKEGESYQAYMEQTGATIEDLVAKFSKTKIYILQRLSFVNLIPEMKKDFYSNKMGPGQASVFARLTVEDQKRCFASCKMDEHEASAGNYKMIEDVNEFISDELMMELKSVAFSLTDGTLVLQAGSCAACPKRSGAGLFGDVPEKDRCYDKACYKLKKETHTLNLVQDLINNNPDTPVIKMDNEATIPAVKKILDKAEIKVLKKWHDFDECAKAAPGAKRALCVAGTSAGKWFYVKIKKQKPKYSSSPSGSNSTQPSKPAETSLKKKIEDAEKALKDVQEDIQGEVIDQLQKKLYDYKPYKSPDPKPLTKYERAAMFLSMEENMMVDRKILNLIDKIKVPGVSPSSPYIRVEQYANMPEDIRNLFCRDILKDFNQDDDEVDYLVKKLAEENTAIKMPEIQAAAKKKFAKQLEAAEKKLNDLKTPPAATKPTPKKK